MKDLRGRLAVVTGGGTGMGRELVRQLSREGCHVALCDISAEAMAETKALCEAAKDAPTTRISTHIADVSDEAQVFAFRDAVEDAHRTDAIHLLFNNAGIGNTAVGGGGSLFTSTRGKWERTFNVCWGGMYFNTRAFLPMLQRADAGHIINTSSINGFWAAVSPRAPHTAYCAAKFAIKGFTEALIIDLRVNAPHIKCSIVMPGHVGTSLVTNSLNILSDGSNMLSSATTERIRTALIASGRAASSITDDDIQNAIAERTRKFQTDAPTSAEAAAKTIIDGVKAERWRILVGNDAHIIDELVRRTPEQAYEPEFFAEFARISGWRL